MRIDLVIITYFAQSIICDDLCEVIFKKLGQ